MRQLKIALVNAGFERGEEGILVSPPLGIMCVGAYLRQHGHEVSIFDWSGEVLDQGKEDELKAFAPEVVGFTVILGSSILRSKKASAWARGMGAKVVWGGPLPSALAEMCLRQAEVDAIVAGEGEETMLELCQALHEGIPLRQVKGIAFLEEGEVVRREARPRIKDLDSLPMPWWEGIGPLGRYLIPYHGRMGMPMVTSRGCPGNCTFCYTKYMWGYRWASRSAAKVIEEIHLIQELEPRMGAAIFDDDLFAGSTKRILEFCDLLRQTGTDIYWNCEIRAADITKPLVARMKEAGCAELLVGVESGSDRLLAKVAKGIAKEDIVKAFDIIHKAGMQGNAMLMVGMPGETLEDFEETERLLRRLKADGFYFGLYLPTPGTEFLQVAKEHGFTEPRTLEEWASLGGYSISSYPQRSMSEVPWERVRSTIDRERRQARYRHYRQALRQDPIGAVLRGVRGRAGQKKTE